MKKYRDLWTLEGDTETAVANYGEWLRKGQEIIDLVPVKGVCVQAGGSFGLFPIKLAEQFDRVYTWEPAPDTWECMVRNIQEISQHQDRITMFNTALGAETSRATIHREHEGNSGALQLEYAEDGEFPVVCIDSLELDSCDLIWLDIEGFEVEALKGAKETIEKYKPVLVIENKGLIPGMGGNLLGSPKVDEFIYRLGYKKLTRMMRDDIYIKE